MINGLTWNALLHASAELLVAVALLVAAVSTLMRYHVASIYDKKLLRVLFATIAMLICNCISWLMLPTPGNLLLLRILSFFDYSFAVIASIFFLGYVFCYTEKEHVAEKKIRRVIWAFGIGWIVVRLALLPTNLIYGITVNGEIYGPLFLVAELPILVTTVVNAITVIKNRKVLGKEMLISFLAYAVYPLLAGILLVFFSASLTEIAGALCVFLTYCIVHVGQAERNAEREIELLQVRSRLLFNQLQPKLIFKALDSVYCLCDEDPKLAQSAVSDFADYLRIILIPCAGRSLCLLKWNACIQKNISTWKSCDMRSDFRLYGICKTINRFASLCLHCSRWYRMRSSTGSICAERAEQLRLRPESAQNTMKSPSVMTASAMIPDWKCLIKEYKIRSVCAVSAAVWQRFAMGSCASGASRMKEQW